MRVRSFSQAPGKAFVRKLEALLYSLLHLNDHNSPIEYPTDGLVISDLEWWEQRSASSTPCGMSFD